jgi:hypothetical protein
LNDGLFQLDLVVVLLVYLKPAVLTTLLWTHLAQPHTKTSTLD